MVFQGQFFRQDYARPPAAWDFQWIAGGGLKQNSNYMGISFKDISLKTMMAGEHGTAMAKSDSYLFPCSAGMYGTCFCVKRSYKTDNKKYLTLE
ncbi:hypothetical protein TNIN_60741 [Trichonephila inaurata madagascariensis]|uniref:Uncharacterized protein n=1 Tax=Trichonephila inaurata madagascariensis TaxID=2747483 RepID=A0A8X6YGF3_9ARAC|nr:hypothetical protein TNIN_60741 [Trichonephila inaurata madagascariensis]